MTDGGWRATFDNARGAHGFARWTERSEPTLLAAAGLFLVVLVIQAVTPDRPGWASVVLRLAELVVWLVFAVDYGARLLLAPDRRAYVRTHLLDLLALVAPFLRPLRLLTLIGVVGTSARRAGDEIRNGLVFVGGVAALLVVSSAALVLDAERGAEDANIEGYGDALWWATVTITTVGYGDRFPVTLEGRAVAAALMLVGISLLGLITASVATWFVKHSAEQLEQGEPDGDATLTTLTLIAERLERLETAQRAHAGPAHPDVASRPDPQPCPHCARTP
jgi:voltage-gated potassium channel